MIDGKLVEAAPLEGLEEIEIDGTLYEAFNTSGGLGSLADTYGATAQAMDYKTIRYPGHCAQMRLLMNDLKLNFDRATLKRVLENAVPQTLLVLPNLLFSSALFALLAVTLRSMLAIYLGVIGFFVLTSIP